MDKYEYKVRADEIKQLIAEGEYLQAAEIADTIDWRRVKSVMMLCTISDLYKINRRFEDARNMLLLAYERRPGGKTICYSLCELCIKTEDFVQAVNYYKEFVQVAPKDPARYILQYKLYEAQDVGLEERIGVLEELKKRDYREKWAYELAYLYHRIGLGTRCVEECDELILWFGEGKYVIKAMELKMLHQPLTAAQQEKYDHRFGGWEVYENPEPAEPQPVEEQTGWYAPPGEQPGEIQQETSAERLTREEPMHEEPQPEELDIQVKMMDVGRYNTINLQAELAAGLKEVLSEEETQSDVITRSILAPLLDADTRRIETPVVEEEVVNPVPEAEVMEGTEVFFGETAEIDIAPQGSAEGLKEILPEEPEETAGARQPEPVTDDTAEIVMKQLQKESRSQSVEQVLTAQPPENLARVLLQESDGQIRLVVPEKEVVEKQITGQMSIEDILNEWERMKKENEEKRREEVRQHVMEQTGNMFTEFEASVRDGLLEKLESGRETGELEELTDGEYTGEQEEYTGQDELGEEAESGGELQESYGDEVPEELNGEEYTGEPEEYAGESEEYAGQDELGEEAESGGELQESYGDEVPEELNGEEYTGEPEEYAGQDELGEEAESGGELQESYGDEVPEELTGGEYTGEPEEYTGEQEEYAGQDELSEEPDNSEELQEPYGEQEPGNFRERQELYEDQVSGRGETSAEAYIEMEELDPEQEKTGEKHEDAFAKTEDMQEEQDEYGEVEELEEIEDSDGEEEAQEPVKKTRPAGNAARDGSVEREKARVRQLTTEEKELYAPFIRSRAGREKLVKAIDNISMAAYTGNIIITGEAGTDTLTLAKNMIREVQMTDSNFSGKVAKITGQGMNSRNVEETLERLKSGALIIEGASGMKAETVAAMHRALQQERLGIIVVLEDTMRAMANMLSAYPQLKESFTARMDVEAMSNDMLVAYGKQYARDMEYSIDELGVLALHTRIEELQTIDHAVTAAEVKGIVDEAISHANRKTLKHFFDILLAKRYDDEDMIILTEKDFA